MGLAPPTPWLVRRARSRGASREGLLQHLAWWWQGTNRTDERTCHDTADQSQVIFAANYDGTAYRKSSPSTLGRLAKLAPSYIAELERGQKVPTLNTIRSWLTPWPCATKTSASPRLPQELNRLESSGRLNPPVLSLWTAGGIPVQEAIAMFSSAPGFVGGFYPEPPRNGKQARGSGRPRSAHVSCLTPRLSSISEESF